MDNNTVPCHICGEHFTPFCEDAKYCSNRCRKIASKKRLGQFPCASCGKLIYFTGEFSTPGKSRCVECISKESTHGSMSSYQRGCRCPRCKGTWGMESRRYRPSRKRIPYRDGEYVPFHKSAYLKRKAAPKVEYTRVQLEQRMSMFSGCWLCGSDLSEGRHIDHVKPLAKEGWDCLANLRPACASCNVRKSALWPLDMVLEKFGLAA